MRALCELLDEHRDALEGDLWELYGLDVRQVFTGALEPRRALMFAERAARDPRGHMRADILGDAGFVGWGRPEYAAAAVADRLAALTLLVHKGLGGSGNPKLEPFPIPQQDKDRGPQPVVPTLAQFTPGLLNQL